MNDLQALMKAVADHKAALGRFRSMALMESLMNIKDASEACEFMENSMKDVQRTEDLMFEALASVQAPPPDASANPVASQPEQPGGEQCTICGGFRQHASSCPNWEPVGPPQSSAGVGSAEKPYPHFYRTFNGDEFRVLAKGSKPERLVENFGRYDPVDSIFTTEDALAHSMYEGVSGVSQVESPKYPIADPPARDVTCFECFSCKRRFMSIPENGCPYCKSKTFTEEVAKRPTFPARDGMSVGQKMIQMTDWDGLKCIHFMYYPANSGGQVIYPELDDGVTKLAVEMMQASIDAAIQAEVAAERERERERCEQVVRKLYVEGYCSPESLRKYLDMAGSAPRMAKPRPAGEGKHG